MEKEKKVLALLLISFGFLLRVLRLRELMGFDWDQEVAAFAVDRILSGDLTLIGQEISIGGIFIGPGYYYLLSVFYWLFGGDPIGAGVMVALLSIVTMTVLFLLTRELFDTKTALLALLIYATNARINFYDRTTAPSNPVILVSLMTVFFLWKTSQGKPKFMPMAFAATAFAAIHLHPAALVLLPLILALWHHWKLPVPTKAQVLASLTSVILIVSPLVAFDLRHDFIDTRGAISAFKTLGDEAYFPLFRVLTTTRIQAENLAALFALGKTASMVLALVSLLILSKSNNKSDRILWFWLIVPILVFAFYTRHIPEYYFLSSTGALVIIIARAFSLANRRFPLISGSALFVALAANLMAVTKLENPLSLKHKQMVVEFIKAGQRGEANVAFDTDYGLQAGLIYLMQKEDVRSDPNQPPTHLIVIPPQRRETNNPETIFGGIKVVESQAPVEP